MLISIFEMRRNMRTAMEMEERPMLSQTGGENGAHHCFDCDWLQFDIGLNR